jgi:hypothetical protein
VYFQCSHFANLSERILIQKDVPKDDLHEDNLKKYLPHFLWLVRDSSLKMPFDGGHQLTPTEYLTSKVLTIKDRNPELVSSRVKRAIMTLFPSLECRTLPPPYIIDADLPEDDPRFLTEITSLFNHILQKITPKQGYNEGAHPNGSILAALAQQYADNLNENKPPNLEWSWQSATEQYLTEFAQKLEDEYERDMVKAIASQFPMEEGTIEISSDVEIIESGPTLLSIHRSCFEKKLKQLEEQVDHLMPFVPTQCSTANAVQDKKRKIYNTYKARIVVIKEQNVVGGRLLTFMKENQHSSQTLCMSKFDEIQKSLRNDNKFSIQSLKLEYDKQAIGPAKEKVFEQKRKLIPDPPTDIKCIPTHNTLLVIWNEPHIINPGIIKLYRVQLLQSSKHKCYAYSDGRKLSVEVPDLTPNTQYTVRVCSIGEPYKSEYSPYINVQTTAGVPTKPNKPEVCSESAGKVKVSICRLAKEHQNGSPVNKVIIQYEENSNWITSEELTIKVSNDIKPIVTSVSLPSISPDLEMEIKTLYYRVAMQNSAGRSEFSEVASLPVNELHPYTTELVICDEDVFPRHVILHLTPPKSYRSSVTHFSIRMKEGKSNQWKTVTPRYEQSEYIVEKLKPAATYIFRVACCNAKHSGAWSNEYKITTKADKPNPPKKPEISVNAGRGKCVLMIPGISKGDDNGSSINRVTIEYDENDCDRWIGQEIDTEMNEKPLRMPLTPICNSSSRDAILYYRARFVNDEGTSDPSEVVQLHVTDLFPNQPENIQVVEVTSNQIKLEWCLPNVNPASVTHFSIKYKKSDGKFKPEEKLDKPYYCASKLLPGTQYLFAISCCNEKHSGEWCNFPTKTMPGPPDPPETPQLYQVQDTKKNRIAYYVTFKKLSSVNQNGSPVFKILVESSNDAESTKWVPQHHPVSRHEETIKVPIAPYVQRSDVNFFYYRACFENEAGRGEYSDTLHISVMDLCPPAPENFHVAQTFARRIRLEWNRPNYNPHSVMHYKVVMAEKNRNSNQWINPVDVKDQFQMYDNLLPARSYRFRAASCNSKFPAGGEWCEEVVVKTKADKPSRPCKPDIRCNLDENGKIRCLLMVTMLSEEQENGSPVEKIIVEWKRRDVSKYDAKEYIACRSNPVESLLIRPPNATETFTIQYRVRMKNQAGSSEPSDVRELESAQMIPGPPKNLVADKDNILFNKILLSWEEPDVNPMSVEYYIIQKRFKPHANETGTSFDHEWSNIKKCDTTDVTKASVTDLTPNTEYQFRIISYNKDGRKCKQSSNILNTCTSPCKPQRPDSTSIVLIVKNQFLATISLPRPPYDETGSEIQEMSIQRLGEHRTPEESTSNLKNPFAYKIPNKQSEMIITDIPIGSATHYIRVKLKNSMGYSAYSQPVGVAPENLKPGAPTWIRNKENMNPATHSIVVEWEAPVLHKRAANKYMFVLKKDSDSNWSQPIKPDNLEQNGDSYKATLRHLSPCTQYKVCVFAANGAVYGDYSEEICILTKAGKPHAPPAPSIYVKEDPTKANVSFEHKIEHDNGASIELIRIEHHTKENGWTPLCEKEVQDPTSDFFNVNIPLESVSKVRFDNQPEYRYRVKLKNKVGEGSPSEVVRLPFSDLKPGKVQSVECKARAHHVTLCWKIPDFHPAIVNSYTIEEQTPDSESSWKPQQICELGTNSCIIQSLASNKTYVYRITAISKNDRKGVPFIVRAKTEEIYPTKPLNLRVDRKCNNMFKIRWKEPQCDPDALYYYKLEVSEDSANMKLVYTCTLTKNCRSKVVGNLNASTMYRIRVTAMNEAKHSKVEESYDEIFEKTPMSKTKRNVASTIMGIPTLGLAAAAFLYATKPDADSTIIDSDDESSYLDEWSFQESGQRIKNGDRTNEEPKTDDADQGSGVNETNMNSDGDFDSCSLESDRHRLLNN